MTDHDKAVLAWYVWHGGLAFIVICIITAIVEHITGENR
jgi:hypothetical protein